MNLQLTEAERETMLAGLILLQTHLDLVEDVCSLVRPDRPVEIDEEVVYSLIHRLDRYEWDEDPREAAMDCILP